MIRFFIIVPTFNSAAFLNQCLSSLISTQPGSFELRVHVQDGGSTDATLRIAEEWGDKGVTCASEPDCGIYDAINKGAAHVGDADVMTWLGSDDHMMPGALATVASIFAQLDHVAWITGRNQVANANGEGFTEDDEFLFFHRDVAEGLHDGRTREFIMQEGTFWRAGLWHQVGGVDGKMRLAGDWDLWRRFAAVTPLYSVSIPLGRFTRRAGQASEDMTSYYAEVDARPRVKSSAPLLSYLLKRWPWDTDWLIETRAPAETKRRGWLWKVSRLIRT